MHDIKIPDGQSGGGTRGSKKNDFEVKEISGHSGPEEHATASILQPSEKVKVKFDKFVQLVATHDFTGIMKQYEHEDVILSTNLLTDLANAHEEPRDPSRKLPIFLLVGVLIGVILTYLIIRF